jgi:hypothetical protein
LKQFKLYKKGMLSKFLKTNPYICIYSENAVKEAKSIFHERGMHDTRYDISKILQPQRFSMYQRYCNLGNYWNEKLMQF